MGNGEASGRAGNTHAAAALELGDLADHRTYRAAGRGHDHGFTRFRLSDVEQAHVGGEAGHAQHAKRQ